MTADDDAHARYFRGVAERLRTLIAIGELGEDGRTAPSTARTPLAWLPAHDDSANADYVRASSERRR